jgi:hypothetical protein
MDLRLILNPEVDENRPGPSRAPHTASLEPGATASNGPISNSGSETYIRWPPGLDAKSPNQHSENLLLREERKWLIEWRERIVKSWPYVGEWRVLLFYGIVEDEDSPWNFTFQDGILAKYSSQMDKDLAAPYINGLCLADRPFNILARANVSNSNGMRSVQNFLGDISLDPLNGKTEQVWNFLLSKNLAEGTKFNYLAMLYTGTRLYHFNKHWVSALQYDRYRTYAIYAACRFFGRTTGFIKISDGLPQIVDDGSPIDLQLEALDHLPLWEADIVTRRMFPHLIERWVTLLPSRVIKFIDSFCCRENLEYIGTQVKKIPLIAREELYRPRRINMNRDLKLPGHSKYGNRDESEWNVVADRPATWEGWNSGFAFSVSDCPQPSFF